MSDFDPATYLDSVTTEQSVRRPPLPIGDYTGMTGEVTVRPWESKKENAKIKSGIAYDIPITIDVPLAVQEALGIGPTVKLTDTVMPQLTELKALDWSPGRNNQLRHWRDATDQNVQGQTFSVRMLGGKFVKVKIVHEMYEGELYDRIGGVAKA